jgi:hypothetical protein
LGIALLQQLVPPPAPGPASEIVVWSMMGLRIITRTPGGTAILGFMPVVPMTLVSVLLVVTVSWLTPKPGKETIQRYFS